MRQGLRSAAASLLRVIGSIHLATRIGQRMNNTGLTLVKNLAIDILLGTAIIDSNVKPIAPNKKWYIPIAVGL